MSQVKVQKGRSVKLSIEIEELQSYMDMKKMSYKDYKSQKIIYNIGAKIMGLLGLELGGKRWLEFWIMD